MPAKPSKKSASTRVKSAKVAEPLTYVTFWLTRDQDPETGAPMDGVDVWLSRPRRCAVGDTGALWLDGSDRLADHHGRWSLADAKRICGTYPDDANMVIRVGPEKLSRDAILQGAAVTA